MYRVCKERKGYGRPASPCLPQLFARGCGRLRAIVRPDDHGLIRVEGPRAGSSEDLGVGVYGIPALVARDSQLIPAFHARGKGGIDQVGGSRGGSAALRGSQFRQGRRKTPVLGLVLDLRLVNAPDSRNCPRLVRESRS